MYAKKIFSIIHGDHALQSEEKRYLLNLILKKKSTFSLSVQFENYIDHF